MSDIRICAEHARADRDSVKDIYGERTPYKQQWPSRVDYNLIGEPDRWVQSACVLCRLVHSPRDISLALTDSSNGCGFDIGVKGDKVVGVRGRAMDRVNKGRLGPKGLNR